MLPGKIVYCEDPFFQLEEMVSNLKVGLMFQRAVHDPILESKEIHPLIPGIKEILQIIPILESSFKFHEICHMAHGVEVMLVTFSLRDIFTENFLHGLQDGDDNPLGALVRRHLILQH